MNKIHLPRNRFRITTLVIVLTLVSAACGGTETNSPTAALEAQTTTAVSIDDHGAAESEPGPDEPNATSAETPLETEPTVREAVQGGDAERYFANVRARVDAATSDSAYTAVTEALPNVTFEDASGARFRATDVAVIGVARSIEPVRAFADDEGDGVEVSVDDENAVWRTYRVDVSVEQILSVAKDVALTNTTTVSFQITADAVVSPADVEAALVTGERALILGYLSPRLTDTDDEVFVVAHNGGFWFDVDEADTITTRSLPEEAQSRLVPPDLRVAELVTGAAEDRVLSPAWDR